MSIENTESIEEIIPEQLTFDQLREVDSLAEYKSGLKDRYVGDIDPATKLREGHGTYTYPNNYFQYQGHWQRGKKQTAHGQASTLLMRDGTRITGDFLNGEITGRGVKEGTDGRLYQGEFLDGEMHGQGLLMYNAENEKELNVQYEGQFHLNQRCG